MSGMRGMSEPDPVRELAKTLRARIVARRIRELTPPGGLATAVEPFPPDGVLLARLTVTRRGVGMVVMARLDSFKDNDIVEFSQPWLLTPKAVLRNGIGEDVLVAALAWLADGLLTDPSFRGTTVFADTPRQEQGDEAWDPSSDLSDSD
jgi:hypothetical protein